MADNIELNLGSGGKTIATDDISGIQHELVKVEFGLDGVATMVSASNPLPVTDNATEVSVASIDTKTPSLGQALSAASTPVVLPATQISTLTPPAAITNFALETGGNLASIKTDVDKIPSQGQALMASSMPVVIASNQSAVPISGTVTITPSGTQDENIKQVNGATVNVGIGAAGTGTQRVSVSSDSTIGLVAGTAIVGKVGIDQTTPGTTNGVQVNAALPAGSNVIGHVIADSGSTTVVTGNVTVIQGTATSLKAQAETYQGGTAVSSSNPLQVTLANTGANTAKLLVTPDSVALPANQSVNVAQLAGTTTKTNSGTGGAGSLNVYIATDQPALTNALQVKSTQKPSYGSDTALVITSLSSLASSATAGWQSARVSNLSNLATDYLISIKATMANTAPASDKAIYVYIVPWYTNDAGSTWFCADGGTATLPSGSEGTYTIASPNNLRLLGICNYTTQQQVCQNNFLLSNCFGNRMPHGWSIVLINFTGAALAATSGSNNLVEYVPLNDILV